MGKVPTLTADAWFRRIPELGADRAGHRRLQAQAVRAAVKGGVQLWPQVIFETQMGIQRRGH